MTRWPRRLPPPRIEPPAWVRHFECEAWSEPDEWERQMAGGGELPEEFRAWHAHRRWVEASNAWYKQHPEADNRLEDPAGPAGAAVSRPRSWVAVPT